MIPFLTVGKVEMNVHKVFSFSLHAFKNYKQHFGILNLALAMTDEDVVRILILNMGL